MSEPHSLAPSVSTERDRKPILTGASSWLTHTLALLFAALSRHEMTAENALSRDRIRALNDAFRRSFVGGTIVVTAGFESLPAKRRGLIFGKIRTFDQFNEDNDPHGEHDFGLIEDGDVRCFWKIDYYDTDMDLMSPDPADSSVTTRVLTVMLAEEY
jgi:hypothetical protein